MEKVNTILITDAPAAITQAICEQLEQFSAFKILGAEDKESESSPPDLIITANKNTAEPLVSPRIEISSSAPCRLGDLLQQIVKILKEPNLYLQNISLGDYVLEPQKKSLLYRGKEEIPLTEREVAILSHLAKHKGTETSREELLKSVWNYQQGVDTHTLETHIYRLRSKIEKASGQNNFLVTGEKGYCLNFQD